MIQANELRIGNWIKNKKDEFLQICQGDDIDAVYYKPDSCFPIPLTPEILEKAGFVKSTGSDTPYEWWEIDRKMQLWDFNNEHWVLDMADQDGIEQKHFKYLHQLQNLYFALTGEELNIEL